MIETCGGGHLFLLQIMDTPKHDKDGAGHGFPPVGSERSWPATFRVVGADDDDSEFEKYLTEKSAATGTPIETLRKLEADAREQIGQESPSREVLRSLAERATPTAKYLEGDEPCPF